jgi:predicted enzyme related to lactoylglutathione lyase
MPDVLRIGGVFFRSQWYRAYLGLPTEDYGGATLGEPGHEAAWAPFSTDADYFGAGDQPFMVNYVTDDLDGLPATLRAEGVEVIDRIGETEFGRFGWAVDSDGRRIELWQPPTSGHPRHLSLT